MNYCELYLCIVCIHSYYYSYNNTRLVLKLLSTVIYLVFVVFFIFDGTSSLTMILKTSQTLMINDLCT